MRKIERDQSGLQPDPIHSNQEDCVGQIDELPTELFQQIISYLAAKDLESLACTNKFLQKKITAIANFKEISSIKKFVRLLIQSLGDEGFPWQRQQFEEILQNNLNEKEDALTLKELKDYILDVKARLLTVIKTLDVSIINNLMSCISPPHFMENILMLSAVEAAKKILDLSERRNAYMKICEALSKQRASKEILQTMLLIQLQLNKDKANAFERLI